MLAARARNVRPAQVKEKVGIRHNKKREEKKGREKENRETYRALQLAALPPRPSSLNAKQAFCFEVFVEALFSFMNMRVRFFSICTFGQCNMSDQWDRKKRIKTHNCYLFIYMYFSKLFYA